MPRPPRTSSPIAPPDDTAPTLTPRLRFPEFRDTPEWVLHILGEQGDFLSSLTGKSAEHFAVGSAKYVTYMNVFTNTFTNMHTLGTVDVLEGESQNAVEVGDVLFTVSSETPEEVGMSSVVLEKVHDCYLNSFCALFRFGQEDRPNPTFVGYLMRQPLVRDYFGKHGQGSTRFNLSKTAFRSLPFALPSPAEQQKIADCLTSLDEVIAAQGRKVEALKAHKKGLMQHLFPQQGQTLPRLRFPEFRDGPEWEATELGEVVEVLNNRRVPLASDQRQPGPYPYYGASGVVDRVADYIFDERLLLVGEDGAKWGAFQRTAFIAEGKYWVNNHAHVLKCVGAVDSLVENYLTMADLGGYVTGNAPPKLTLAKLKSISIPVPQLKAEQQRIAACLSTLDARLAAEAARLDALKAHKKGLMQGLFPAPEGS